MALLRGKRKKTTPVRRRNTRRKQRKWQSNLLRVLIVLAIAGIVFFLFIQRNARLGEYSIGSLFAPVQNAVSEVTRKVKGFFTDWHNYDVLQGEYEELTRENERLSRELSNSEETALENERLKELLDAKTGYDTLDPIYARIISRNTSQWLTTFSINRGEMNGITEGMAVVNGQGLIGRVYKVGLNYADVITIIDNRSGVGCLVQRTRDAGIMRGGVLTDEDASECYVHYLPNTSSVMPGDVVVTSGTDATYPKGITIGTVTEVSLEAGAEGNYAVVRPAVDFQHIEEVLVLREVVERAMDGALPSVPTASPAPTIVPEVTPESNAAATAAPRSGDDQFAYPTPSTGEDTASSTDNFLETIPEDAWAEQ